MFVLELKKNMYFYLIIKYMGNHMYELEEMCTSYEIASKYVKLNGNSKYIILKLKLKDVIHEWRRKKNKQYTIS